MKYIIQFECKEARNAGDYLITNEGSKCWVTIEREGWVEATSMSLAWSKTPPKDSKLFDSEKDAHNFMKHWEGHPWYNVPNGNYKVIPVVQKFKQVEDGFEVML